MNPIYLRRRSKVFLPEASGSTPVSVLAALQKNVESLGFLLSERVVERLKSLDPIKVEAFYHRLVKELQVLVGGHRPFKPFYPDFPTQVMELSEAGLYFNAILHYMTGFRPTEAAHKRPALVEEPRYRVIDLGTREDFEGIFTLLARSKSPLSPQDKEDVAWFVAQYRESIAGLMPGQIPCKENLAFLGAELLRHAPEAAAVVDAHVKTATDVLRLAVALSDGDVSLATACKFGKFKRKQRALLLGWVERAENRTEDMLRWKSRWIRLGERLHPGEFAAKFQKAAAAFDILRNNRPFSSFNGKVETSLARGDTDAALELLETRPGDLARRLDHLARTAPKADAVVERFSARAAQVSTPVLLQGLAHFRARQAPGRLRVFFPKGEVGNLFATEEPLPALPGDTTTQLVTVCEQTLVERFAKLPPLGACYLDPRMRDYLVPFAQRSAAKALRTLVRGSRVPLPACDTLRFFVWWKNGTSRVDVDLSAAMYDTHFKYIDTLAYYNLKNFGAHHSGDITDAPNGAAEFIDVDVTRCAAKRVRFVVMCLNNFTQQPYCDLPECFAGWMARTAPNSGAVFEPKTVADRVDVSSDTQICLPAIFDLANREVIWADIALKKAPRYANNVSNNLGGVSLMLRAMTGLQKPDLHTLFALHVRARGTVTTSPDAADTVFAPDRGLTPFDLERISAEFL